MFLAANYISDITALAISALLTEFVGVLVLPLLEKVLGPDHAATQLGVHTFPGSVRVKHNVPTVQKDNFFNATI